MEENQSIAQLKRGDIDGMEFLARKYYLRALRAAYLIIHDHALAEDVVQNCFINLSEKISQYDDSKPFQPWFMRIVINNAISACRKYNREIFLEDFDENEDHFEKLLKISGNGRSVEDTYISNETKTAIWNFIEELNPQQRAAVVLRYYLNLSENELVEELHRPKSTIKWILFTARQKLRHLLEPLHNQDKKPGSILEHERNDK
jgi:RNA polymerase sigma-70 factor, ECF subfamily